MNRQQQGDMGEASARCWYELHGWTVLIPTGRSPDYDFVADDGERLVKVQVKTTGRRTPYGRWELRICTRGGNQSWSGVVKRFSSDRCDVLFAVTADGHRWCIPSHAVEATTGVCLGGSKYAEYEVEPGPPLAAGLTLVSLPSRAPAG